MPAGVAPPLWTATCQWTLCRDEYVKEMVQHCLFCADYKTGGLVPDPSRDAEHGTKVEAMVYLDFLCKV